jgi:glycosyltransferase involved in cell wall biosynthesis
MEGYIKQSERKKILLLCDDIRFNSGISTMARSFVVNTSHVYNWVIVGALTKHPDQGKRLDLSADTNKLRGIDDAYVHLLPNSGYGNAVLLRSILRHDNPDAVMIFTDPRYWVWLFDMEREIRSKRPLMYLNIWDNYPAPYYNKPYYESCDLLMAISKQTANINRIVLGEEASEKVITYVPHGIDHRVFYPITATDPQSNALREFRAGLEIPEDNFVVFWNSRNLTRKRSGDIIRSFQHFVLRLTPEQRAKCTLLMHTDPLDSNGTNLYTVKELLCDSSIDVKFTTASYTAQQMNYLYNIADVGLLVSSNEGWGLSLTETMMAGRMIVGVVTGGMQDQMRFEDENGNWIEFDESFQSNHRGRYKKAGEWAVHVFPADIALVGSLQTPYIFDDRANVEDIADALEYVYLLNKEERQRRGLAGRTWAMSDESGMSADSMAINMIKSIRTCFETFKPRAPFDLINATAYKKEVPQYINMERYAY